MPHILPAAWRLVPRLCVLACALVCLMLWPARVAHPSNRGANENAPEHASSGVGSAKKFNGKIVFYGLREVFNQLLYVMNPDGSSQTKLTVIGPSPTSTGFESDVNPAWSPDGTKLAFSRYIEGEGSSIFTMDADGSNLKRLTRNANSDFEPAWSPDGTKIAFERGTGCVVYAKTSHNIRTAADNPCAPYIWVINADGTNETELSFEEGETDPVWSPDGSKIAFTKLMNSAPGGAQVYLMNADGSHRVRLTNNIGDYDAVGSWSPDGSKLAFYSDREPGSTGIHRFQIYVMNADGTNPTRLTNDLFNDSAPVFSPDGTKIAFQRTDDGPDYNPDANWEIYVMNADGSAQTNITNHKGADFGPVAWQPLSSPATVAPPAVLQFGKTSYQVDEGAGTVDVSVTRSGSTNEALIVEYETADGTAASSADYTFSAGTLHFAPGEMTKTITVLITGDLFVENTETFKLSLFNLSGNVILGTQSEATVSIVDDDHSQPTSNPLDDPRFFVRQQYHDFLNREPDAEGLAYWTNEITKCGTDAQCVRRQRVNVSTAFFMSQEFADTGFFVFRLYQAGTGRAPTYNEYMRERDQLIGGPGLEAQKQALIEDFMQGNTFKLFFLEPQTHEQFVNALFNYAGLYSFRAEREQETTALQNGLKTRAQVFRDVIELEASRAGDYNSVFVYMQYFGYLARDPDFGGYSFWLNILTHQAPNNYQAMVCAFITSAEYQKRFSPILTHNNTECAP